MQPFMTTWPLKATSRECESFCYSMLVYTVRDETSSTIIRWQRYNKKRPSGPVVVGRRPCEPLNNLTLFSLGGGSRLKKENYPSPIRLVF